MDLDKIREFLSLAKTLNFTQTARELHVSVSTLSKHINMLEDELGTPLIVRRLEGGTNALTPAGIRFAERTRPWLDEFSDICKECQNLHTAEPPVRISGTTSSIIRVISQLRHALEPHGVVGGNFTCNDERVSAREAIDRNLADFACYYEPVDRLRWVVDEGLGDTYGWIALAPERTHFLARSTSAAAAHESLSLADLAGFRIVDMDDSLYNNWLAANTELLRGHGCLATIGVVSAAPLSGGAFNLSDRDLVLSTDSFTRYYCDLDVEDVVPVRIKDYDALVYPFLVYRRDNTSPAVRRIVEAIGS